MIELQVSFTKQVLNKSFSHPYAVLVTGYKNQMKGLDRILNYFMYRLHTLMQILKITVTGVVSSLYTFSITDIVYCYMAKVAD